MSFPTDLDAFNDPTASDKLNSPSHSSLHQLINAAVEALEAKVGTGSSAATSGTVLRATGSGTSEWGGVVMATHMIAFTSADIQGKVSDETGSGSLVFGTNPAIDGATLTAPVFVTNADLNGVELILDADGDTSITADTDDQIDIEIAGADDFRMLANIFRALSGSV